MEMLYNFLFGDRRQQHKPNNMMVIWDVQFADNKK